VFLTIISIVENTTVLTYGKRVEQTGHIYSKLGRTKRPVRPDTIGFDLLVNDNLCVNASVCICDLSSIEVKHRSVYANLCDIQDIGPCQETGLVKWEEEEIV
jgi:hypothetical protein